MKKNKNNIEGSGDGQYLVYGHWFVLFAASLLLTQSRINCIPEQEDARKLVLDALNLVARACNQHKAVAHYQMFRSYRTKEKIIMELNGKQTDMFELFEKQSS